jgi:2-phospho-L-lactate guanylyltransferase
VTELWLIIPVKPFGEGKSRLAASLSPAQRAALSQRLLERVLRLAHETGRFAARLVISRDPAVAAAATAAGAVALGEERSGLNAALSQARAAAVAAGAGAILVLPADLPQVTAADLQRLVDACRGEAGVVIAPSRDGGTNALLLWPPDVLDFDFGPDSFRRHCDQAARKGLAVSVVESSTLAFDLDRPQDLALEDP